MSLSKFCEELNITAYKWAKSQPSGSEPTAVEQDELWKEIYDTGLSFEDLLDHVEKEYLLIKKSK